jgi:hypothetical protein
VKDGMTWCVQEGPVISDRYMEIRGLQAGPAYGLKIRAVVANCHNEADNEIVASKAHDVSEFTVKKITFGYMFKEHIIRNIVNIKQ